MSNLFTVAHVAKLHEIQSARLRRNLPGIGREVEDLIRHIERGGARPEEMMDERTRQAKVLWDLGVGRELGFKKLEDYLATIPQVIPHNDHPELFDRLVLVERRLRVMRTAKLLGVYCHLDDEDELDDYLDRTYPPVEFVWCQDGRKNQGLSVRNCRDAFVNGVEIGLTAIEGLCLFAQDRRVLDEPHRHHLDLPGSKVADFHDKAACLGPCGDKKVRIIWSDGNDNRSQYGSASRRA